MKNRKIILVLLIMSILNIGFISQENIKIHNKNNDMISLIKAPKTSDSKYLYHDKFAVKIGWAEDYINWGFSTDPVQAIEVWALDSDEYSSWILGGEAEGIHLSSQSSDSGMLFVTYGDYWHIIFWNNHSSSQSTLVTYGASFYGDTRPPSITVTRPYSGLSYETGSSQIIKWDSINAGSNVKIELYKGTSLYSTVYASTSNDGEQSWTVPLLCPPDTDYRIKISSTSTGADDYSNYFTIIEVKSLTIIEPSNTTIYIPRVKYGIKWNSTGLIDEVTIELYENSSFIQNVAFRIINDGSCLWTIPVFPEGSNYRMKIYEHFNPKVYNYSSYFTITSEKYITIVEPSSDMSYVPGDTCNIKWVTDAPCETVEIDLYYSSQMDFYYVLTIESNTTNDGLYSWKIPSSIDEKNNYRIKISATDGSCSDIGDYFTIGIFIFGINSGFFYGIIIIISIISIVGITSLILKKKHRKRNSYSSKSSESSKINPYIH